MNYQPTIVIGTEPIDAQWDGTSLVAVGEISLEWGRSDVYAPVNPLEFDLTLIDPSGQWATDSALSGKPVVISRPGGHVLLRGTIADVESTWAHTQSPQGDRVPVWLVHLTGTCKLADLAQARILGPGYTVDGTFQPGAWIHATALNRANRVLSQGAAAVVDSIQTVDIGTALGVPASGPGPLQFIDSDESASMTGLDHVSRIYAAYPLAHVNYNPTTNGLEIGSTASSAGFRLSLVAGKIVMDPVSGVSVSSHQVGVPDGYTTRSTVSQAVDVVQVGLSIYDDIEWVDTVIQGRTARGTGSPTSRVLELPTVFRDDINRQTGRAWANALISLTAALVDDINDQFSPPTLQFDLRRFDYPPALIDVLLDTKDRPVPLYFVDSVFANLANYAAQFQIIGGQLQWFSSSPGDRLPSGWVLNATVVPATGTLDAVAIASLVTNTAPALEDYDEAISLSDLGNVTIGLN